ncbi:hypothetical protein SAMIE_1021870 [Sphingobium amiense]|uniref:Uncharacterized protein n=1 Tax=Sphingobium amiense TaxID=135719 RepID=A0A494W5U1_9SPHN|nr:hypothetical protein [Sphingobium amiense]BBD98686.1 hypothetical protein SAMIE_1021870 [Sphingobium amiense]
MKFKVHFSLYILAAMAVPFVGIAQTAQGPNYILLSDKYGDPGYVGLMAGYGARSIDDPMDGFSAGNLSGSEVASLFQKTCLAKPFDAAAYAEAMKSNAPEFRPTVANLPDFSAPKPLIGSFSVAATTLSQNVSDYGISDIWLGEDGENLNNRPFARFSGSLIITGPFGTKNSYAPQCNFIVKVNKITDSKELIDAVQAALPGFTATKRVEKPKYGYGIWLGSPIEGRIPRVTVTASKLNKPEQVVYLTIQLLPPGVVK